MYGNRYSYLPRVLLAGVVLIVVQATIPAQAQLKGTIEELTQASDLVIVGRVAGTHAQWIDKRIITTSIIHPIKILKGEDPGETVQVWFLGGTVGDICQSVSHEATLHKGEVAMLFLMKPDKSPPQLSKQLRIVGELGKIPLVASGENESRLRNNRRLKHQLKGLEDRVRRGVTP